MNFIPQKYKYKKQQKGKKLNKVGSPFTLNRMSYNVIGLKSLSSGRITSKQLDSFYRCISKHIKKSGRVTLHIYPQTPVTKKPIEVRMGKGKGNVAFWVAKVNAGVLICEIESNSSALALKALKQAQLRISLKTKILYNYGV